ncbi:MAG: ethanolamine utilization protein, partial [Aquabacterium sp.]|uniref:exonuclease domain-containing protein n=1 Tax=Aquabacterium sp. TaxID=1872578 RepID=UPI001202B267
MSAAQFQPMVFVDLETTGSTGTVDRITEIGIVELNEEGEVREWSSLVNPQTSIPSFIQSLTGITHDMVADAPTFAELADEVLSRLHGRLFVAHNARFDYGFLKNEFKRLDLDFKAPVLCTVKLSRKLFPQYSKHNLDALVERHQLHMPARHRALADADVLRQFWQVLQSQMPADQLDAAVGELTGRSSWPVQLDPAVLAELPERHGVYLFFGDNELPLYIGKANNIRQR